MNQSLVIGLVASARDAESLINNLLEQDFSRHSLSVVTANSAESAAMGVDHGPLHGVGVDQLSSRLVALGMPAASAASMADAIRNGQTLVAIKVSEAERDAARRTLESAGSQVEEVQA